MFALSYMIKIITSKTMDVMISKKTIKKLMMLSESRLISGHLLKSLFAIIIVILTVIICPMYLIWIGILITWVKIMKINDTIFQIIIQQYRFSDGTDEQFLW